MIGEAACVIAYLLIGLLFEVFGPPGDFDVRTLFFWPFGIGIYMEYWFNIRRIKREGSRLLAEAVKERDSKLSLVDLQWTGEEDEALITMSYGSEISRWLGSRTTWRNHRDTDERASVWLSCWLCGHWISAHALKEMIK